MYCHGTDVTTLAQEVHACLQRLTTHHPHHDFWRIAVYLQGEEAQAGGGHPHYGVYADTSYGGHPEAVALLQAALPTALYCLRYDTAQYGDVHAAFAAALDEALTA